MSKYALIIVELSGLCQGDAELLRCDGEAHDAGGGGEHGDEGGEEQRGQVG